MERKEPTLSSGIGTSNSNEREEVSSRSSASAYDEPRQSRPNQMPSATHNSPLPAIALVVALAGVAGAGFLGWKLTETQAALVQAAGRITQLENQLNVTSTESTASLGSLQVNLKTVDGDVKNLREVVRKTNLDHNDKHAALSKSIDGVKGDVGNVKGEINSIKQDVLAHKATLDEFPVRLDALDKQIAEQRKRVQDVATSVTSLQSQVKNAEGLTKRLTTVEEAIDAIDDNRRIINRDLVQIKQQLGIKN